MSLFLMYCCMAHSLFVPFLEISRVSGNRNPSFTPSLIIITVLTNNSSIFCSSLKFLHLTWQVVMVEQQLQQYLCVTFFTFCWWDLIGRFTSGIVFSFQDFFPALSRLFIILFHFQEGKKAQQTCELSGCCRESPSFNRFHRVYWIIKFFSQ